MSKFMPTKKSGETPHPIKALQKVASSYMKKEPAVNP
jgi:hypothetical protein